MNAAGPSESESLPLSVEKRIDDACNRFEDAWGQEAPPRIDGFLGELFHDGRSWQRELLVELIHIDLEYRWRRAMATDRGATNGDSVPPRPLLEDYVARWPLLGAADALPIDLVRQEYRVRRMAGERPAHAEYHGRFAAVSGIAEALDVLDRRLDGHEGKSSSLVSADAGDSNDANSGATGGASPIATSATGGLSIRCPQCRQSMPVADDSPLADIACSTCGSHFSILGDDATAPTGRVPRRIAHFELVEQLGVGGFGSVWKARDTQLDRWVAVKIPRKGELDAIETQQFLREARAAAQLSHPNIVATFEVGRDVETIYIVSELVAGQTLSERLTSGPLPQRGAASLCAKLADALDHAHAAGIVHRDLKPANVMLDAAGEPHIMDFGLAKRDVGEMTMTLEGKILGTPAYMSPEQARGQGHHADRRSDIYSLGVILFELLTGELPFRGSTQMLIAQILSDDPPSPRKLDRRVSRDLETICLRCLEKDPARRYATGRDVADELSRWLRAEPIRARPVGNVGRVARWCRRRPLVATLGGLLALVTIAVAIVGPLVAAYQARLRYDAESLAGQLDVSLGEQKEQTRIARDLRQRESKLLTKAEELSKNLKRSLDEQTRQTRTANVLRLAAQSRVLVDEFPQRALLLAAEAVDLGLRNQPSPHPAAHQALRDVLAAVSGRGLFGHPMPVTCLAVSPDGRRLITGGVDGAVFAWDLSADDPVANRRELSGHDRAIYAIRFSGDGNWLVTASGDGTARLWNMRAPNPADVARVLEGHRGAVRCVAIGPDNRWLATGGQDGVPRLWDLTAANPAASRVDLAPLAGPIRCVGFTSDGRRLVVAGDARQIHLWTLGSTEPPKSPAPPEPSATESSTTWEMSAAIDGRSDTTHCLALSPNGSRLATAGSDAVVRIWDLGNRGVNNPTATPIELKGHQGVIRDLVISGDGRWLASASVDRTSRLWDLPAHNATSPSIAPSEPVVLAGHESIVRGVAISPDSHWLVTAGEDKTSRVWDLTAKDPRASCVVLRGHEDVVSSAAFSSDGRWLATGSFDRSVRLHDLVTLASAATPIVMAGHRGGVRSVAFHPDNRTLATGSTDGITRIWTPTIDGPHRRPLVELAQHRGPVCSAAFSGDGRWLVTGSEDHTACLWRRNGQSASATDWQPRPILLSGHAERVGSVAIAPDSRRVATASWDGTVRLWDLASPQPDAIPVRTFKRSSPILSVAIAPDGRWLASASERGLIRFWTLDETPRDRQGSAGGDAADSPPTDDEGPRPPIDNRILVTSLAVTPDGRRLISGDFRGKVRCWDLTDENRPTAQLLEGHPIAVTAVAVGPDGRWLATASHDKTIRLWDLKSAHTPSESIVLGGHARGVNCVAIGPDGRWLASGSDDGTARLWPLRLEDLTKHARRTAGRDLSPQEREQYLLDAPATQE